MSRIGLDGTLGIRLFWPSMKPLRHEATSSSVDESPKAPITPTFLGSFTLLTGSFLRIGPVCAREPFCHSPSADDWRDRLVCYLRNIHHARLLIRVSKLPRTTRKFRIRFSANSLKSISSGCGASGNALELRSFTSRSR